MSSTAHTETETSDQTWRLGMNSEREGGNQLRSGHYNSSYYLPGNLEGREVPFPVYSDCNTNLVARHVWKSLQGSTRTTTRTRKAHRAVQDGTEMDLQGVLELTGQIQ